MKRYMIAGLSESRCPFCLEADGRKVAQPTFQVVAEGGGFAGVICAPHLAAMYKAEEAMKNPPKPEPKVATVAAVGNGPPK